MLAPHPQVKFWWSDKEHEWFLILNEILNSLLDVSHFDYHCTKHYNPYMKPIFVKNPNGAPNIARKELRSINNWLVYFSFSQPPKHKREPGWRIQRGAKLSLVCSLLFNNHQTKRNIFKGTILLQMMCFVDDWCCCSS